MISDGSVQRNWYMVMDLVVVLNLKTWMSEPTLELFAIAEHIVYNHVPYDLGFDLVIGICDEREYVGNEYLQHQELL